MFQPGEIVRDRYRVVRLIGSGGMGEVYELEDVETGDALALKTILPRLLGNATVKARFQREIQLSRRIRHPNVVKIHDVFEHPRPIRRATGQTESIDAPCMVMDYLAGQTLADRLAAGPLTTEEARPVACHVAAALAAAHRLKIVHRDLKPDNVFLVPQEDGGLQVVVTDFGVARMHKTSKESLTESNIVLGTPDYMAPEQLELEEAIPASDIYTLGLVMYEMVTGHRPFEAGATPIENIFLRVTEDPKPPQQHVPDLDPRWVEVILRCLERKPADRYASPLEIIDALEGKAGRRRYDVGRTSYPWLWAVLVGVVLLSALAYWLIR